MYCIMESNIRVRDYRFGVVQVQGGDMTYYLSTMQGLRSVLQPASAANLEQVRLGGINSKVLGQLERFLDCTSAC
jgi:hypothetical protein